MPACAGLANGVAGSKRTQGAGTMKYSTAGLGRVFVVRLEDGDVVHEAIEELARREGVQRAVVLVLGGADDGSRLVVGPRDGRPPAGQPIEPMERLLDGVHEMAGVGTVFPERRRPCRAASARGLRPRRSGERRLHPPGRDHLGYRRSRRHRADGQRRHAPRRLRHGLRAARAGSRLTGSLRLSGHPWPATVGALRPPSVARVRCRSGPPHRAP